MSIMGLAARPGTAVDPTCWIGPCNQGCKLTANWLRSFSNSPGHAWSYCMICTGASLTRSGYSGNRAQSHI